MIKEKNCSGNGKAKDFDGCETLTDVRYLKYGLCRDCFQKYDFENRFKKLDSTLNKNVKDYQRKRIARRSKKRIAQEKIYSQLRKAFLNKEENKVCPIMNTRTTTVHHKKGRLGDLLTDTRYWIALSMEGHVFVEQNVEWAKANGFSLSRLEKE
jgi:hypothetical protein